MTEKELIQKQIEELQAKLEELEKQEPQMTFKSTGDVDVVFYDQKYYYCMRFSPTGSSWWMRQGSALFLVHDRETNTKLEQLYEDMILDTGGVPEEGIWNYDSYAKFRKQEEAKKLQEKEWTCKVTDEKGETNPYKQYMNNVKNLQENNWYVGAKSLVNPPTLWERFYAAKWSDSACDEFCEIVEQWLPKEQSANSQNTYVELTVEGFNECLKQIKSKLRRTK